MPFQIVTTDLADICADAVIYAETKQPFSLFQFNPLLLQEKGKELLKSREQIGPLSIGDAKIIAASKISASHIIHTSPPVWHGGLYHELKQLRGCYEKSFQLAWDFGCRSIALPVLATDGLGYPKSTTKKMAFECIDRFLKEHDAMVCLIFPKRIQIILPGNQYSEINKLLTKKQETASPLSNLPKGNKKEFSSLLSRMLQEKGLSEQELYIKANLSASALSELLKEEGPLPEKRVTASLAIGLSLSLEETSELFRAAGYALTKNDRFDLVIEYFLSKKIYDIWNINQALFRFELPQLGANTLSGEETWMN